jgi:hypothetical protein
MPGHYVYQLAEVVSRARKFVRPTFCEITSSRFGRRALLATLRSGFLVEDGTPAVTPARRM